MEIRFGDWTFDVEKVDKSEVSYSRLTLEQLHFFEVKLNVDNDEVNEFERLFEEYKAGEVLISDEELELTNGKFNAKIKYSSTSSIHDYKSYVISFEECCSRVITGIEFEGQRFEAYEISQEISKNAVVIDAKVIVTPEQFNMINHLRYCSNVKYFPVIRLGISETPIQMRFGRNLWSEKDGMIKMALILVEEEYDKAEDHFHGMAEPELSIAIKQIKQLKAVNARLLDVLKINNLITEEQKVSIEQELTMEELKQEQYLFDRVNDVDEWR